MTKKMTIAIVCICVLAACLICAIALFGTGIGTINPGAENPNQGDNNNPVPTGTRNPFTPTVSPTAKPVTGPNQGNENDQTGDQTESYPGFDVLWGYWYGEEAMTFGIAFIQVPANGQFHAKIETPGEADFWCCLYGLENYGVTSDLPYVIKFTWVYNGGDSYTATTETGEIIPFTCDGNMIYMEINPVTLNLIENDMAKMAANKDIPIHLYKKM